MRRFLEDQKLAMPRVAALPENIVSEQDIRAALVKTQAYIDTSAHG